MLNNSKKTWIVSILTNINIEHYLHEAEDINQPYNVYQDELVKVIDKHIPFKYLSRKEFRWKLKPWITNGIKKSIKLKNKYYKKYTKNKSNYWFKLYKFYLNSIKRLTFASKRNHYKKYFEQNINNCKKIWNGINEVLKNHKKSANEEIFLNEDGMVITDQKRVANSFNHFYTNVADNLLLKIGNTTTKYQDYLKNPNEHSFYMNEVDFGEVYKILKNLDITKSGDIYGISPTLLKLCSREITPNLTKLFNLSLKLGQFPDKLKVAKIIPIYKGDSKLEPGNYRPISLLPIIGKVFEKVVHERVYNFIEKYLADNQYGFQRGKSTEHALLELQSKIIRAYETKLYSCQGGVGTKMPDIYEY